MGNILDRAVELIAAAAGNTYSFVAYVLAVGAWVAIAWRVNRNKQVLAAIRAIPPDERLTLLELEMGVVRVPRGLTPEQWLRTRQHTFYFAAFVVFCALVAVLFALAVTAPKPPVENAVTIYRPVAVRQHANELDVLKYIRLRAQRSFVEFHAGPPQLDHKVGDCRQAAYAFSKFYLVVVYDRSQELTQYSVTLRDRETRLQPPWQTSHRIGDATFVELDEADAELIPAYANMSPKNWQYAEMLPDATLSTAMFVTYSDMGVDFDDELADDTEVESHSTGVYLSEVLMKVTDTREEELTAAERRMLSKYREVARPNGYAEALPMADCGEFGHGIIPPLVDFYLGSHLNG